MELATRRVRFAGCAANADESWMCQVARNLSDAEDGFLRGKNYLLMDRDTKFSQTFRIILNQAGLEAVRLPARSPNLNPNLERFIRSVKEECLERMIFFGERSLQVAVAEFLSHFHAERNHQGLGNRLIAPGEEVGRTAGDVARRRAWAGMQTLACRLKPDPLAHPGFFSLPSFSRSACNPMAAPRFPACGSVAIRPCTDAP